MNKKCSVCFVLYTFCWHRHKGKYLCEDCFERLKQEKELKKRKRKYPSTGAREFLNKIPKLTRDDNEISY